MIGQTSKQLDKIASPKPLHYLTDDDILSIPLTCREVELVVEALDTYTDNFFGVYPANLMEPLLKRLLSNPPFEDTTGGSMGKTDDTDFDLNKVVKRLAAAMWEGLAEDGAKGVNTRIYSTVSALCQDRFEAGRRSLLHADEVDTILEALTLYEEGGRYLSNMRTNFFPIKEKLRMLRIKKE